ncbi:glycosyltransferase family 4 protein [Paenibacillus montanisoli]|uniref:Glycosyltransferase family 1 protein n=1 Tax=Paenibacillus montanisoli TaxID=2081970 RepID=A0A328U3W0_9BACL|nr:glycosyltransferase family 4 protein [Paenibacillus montanisoli]RAP77478.1 glycosyltransferase family 1 protein [Paenibacillus montanisoli]
MSKVAHICTSSSSHKILVDKLMLMKQRGYDIHLISSQEGYDEEMMKQYTLKLKFVPMNRSIRPFQDLRSIYRLIRLIKLERYDIVHTHTAKAGLIGRIAAWITRTPLIVHTTHGLPFYEGQGALKNWMYRTLEIVGSFFCDAIASQNKEDIVKIKDFAPGKRVFYEGNGVDLDHLDRRKASITREELQKLRYDLQIDSSKKVLLVAARLEPVKNHSFLLAGIQQLVQSGKTNFVCLLAGKGPLESQIRAEISAFGLEEYVRLIGHQSDIYPYIQLADLISLTSEKEGIPRIIMEAMAFSKPVIASDVLGTRELVQHMNTGLLVPYLQEKELANALKQVLFNDEWGKLLGQNGRKVIEREFTEEAVTQRIDHYYRQLNGGVVVKRQIEFS